MTIRLVFAGAGEGEASDADRQAMQALATAILAQASGVEARQGLKPPG
jgi:hypothetical protein